MIFVLAFLASGAAVVLAGIVLARNADAIAEATGIGRLWVGSVLLAAATSLPELVTDVSAVRMGAADLAVGDLFGSSLANMLVLAVIDLVSPRSHILQRVSLDHALGASLAIFLNGAGVTLVLLRPEISLLGVGPGSVLIAAIYLFGTRVLYQNARSTIEEAARALPADARRAALRRILPRFCAAALLVLVTAPAFAWSAKGIADLTGLGRTVVGTVLVGLATSLPELVASLAAVRMGAFDLAVGNLFGSNALNMAILLPLELAAPGNLFATIDPDHAITGLFAVLLMSLGMGSIVERARRRVGGFDAASIAMLLGYGLAITLLIVREL